MLNRLRAEYSEHKRAGAPEDPSPPTSEKTPTRRFLEQGFGHNQGEIVKVCSDIALLPQKFEFAFAPS